MLKNHFKTAWRNLMKNKIFSFINVVGLTIGLTSFLLIALYIFDELTFDRFHKNTASIYRVVESSTTPDGKETRNGFVSYQATESARADFPEIRDVARFALLGRVNVASTENTNVFYEPFWTCNNGFLQMFDFKMLYGDKKTALSAPHTVVVTERGAHRLFGTTNVLGKTIKAGITDSLTYLITGVLQDFPVNSQFSFDYLFSETIFKTDGLRRFIEGDWDANNFASFLLLDKRAKPDAVATKISRMVAGNLGAEHKNRVNFILQPLKDVHFKSANIEGNLGKTGSITYLYVFSVIGLFVLLIACINYMNLTTARFANRAKEIGVRKVTGASRGNLAGQFLSEAFLVTLIALTFALALVKILLPAFNGFTEKALALGTGTDYRIWVGIVLIAILVGLLSGIYPALFQSRLRPLLLLKSKLPAGKGNIPLRKGLVVFQFALSIIMIIATIVVYQQMKYVSTKDMGFNKTLLLIVDINSGKVRRAADVIKSEFASLPQIKDVALTSRVPGEWKDIPIVKVKNEHISTTTGNDMFFLGVDEQFLQTYQIKLLKGRNLRTGGTDSLSVMINETAAKELGITEPEEQLIEIPHSDFGGNKYDVGARMKVVGIVKDFNFKSLREPLAPMVLGYQKNPVHQIDYFTARISTGDISATLKQMDAIIRRIDPNHLFELHFLDKQWELFYREDKIRETIFLIAAMLAILIACLGLFGLATYAAEQRIKEIGIRKVLGASVERIVTMLSKDFLQLVLLAAVIAFPVAWFVMDQWLEDFAFRIRLSWWIFALAGLIAVVIALVTVSFNAVKAAMTNPVKSLRAE